MKMAMRRKAKKRLRSEARTLLEINEIAGGPSHHLITDPHVPMWITSSLRTVLPVRQSRKLGTAAAGKQ